MLQLLEVSPQVAQVITAPLQTAMRRQQREHNGKLVGTKADLVPGLGVGLATIVIARSPQTAIGFAARIAKTAFLRLGQDPTVCYDLDMTIAQVENLYTATAAPAWLAPGEFLGWQECTDPTCPDHEQTG
ncbi:hypothetical protein [Pseudonocardia sp. ICBG1142]|uniref:hypothetical protein n=1 Tax=Pseudonocardia sp. ICBG1142 TaxID=2846760 RepID=UPI001CF658E6|nr:hypothetical protein [Pseudonocardia sp. ICBG1142]